jgi:D-alanyl-D-alanine-carboxypeptidase/D-alanyl-D-alanine-endopeptidase
VLTGTAPALFPGEVERTNYEMTLQAQFSQHVRTGLMCVAGAMALAGSVVRAQVGTPPAGVALPSDAEIRRVLADRIDVQRRSLGMVVGILDPNGRRVVGYGQSGDPLTPELSGDTAFRIASVTKVFTALLLADMVERGEIRLQDPVQKYLPTGTSVPGRNGQLIQFIDLVTHTSGLPPRPPDFPSLTDPAAAAYSAADLFRSLNGYTLARDPGSAWDYGNLDFAVLGHALATRARMEFGHLLEVRVTGPLGLRTTGLVPTRAKGGVATGHDVQLDPIVRVETPALEAAGSMWSSADDLLGFLAAVMGYTSTTLKPAMDAMLATSRPMPSAGGAKAEQALGWFVMGEGANRIVSHDGNTPGFAAAIAFDPASRVGIVVLSNASAPVGDIARHFLRPGLFPLAQAPPVQTRVEVAIDPARLDVLVGRYALASGAVFAVSRQSDTLVFQSASTGPLRLRPSALREFFASEIDLQVTFNVDSEGRSTDLVLHQQGRAASARRIESVQ